MGHGDKYNQPWEHGPRGRRGSRMLAWVAVGVASLLVAGLLAGYVAYRNVFGKIHQVSVSDLGKRPPKFNNSLNILVIGSDTRKGKNDRFGAHIGGQRSDTILVLHLSPGLKRAVVISIPRDSVVPVLNCPKAPGAPGQTAAPGQVEQINATFALGGPGCLWKTVEQTTHIRLDHFMELNFTGFEQVINDLGGVKICLPFAISDPRSRLHLASGVHHVWGAQALAYWRVRYIGLGSDLERIQRDQFLMASVAQEIKRSNVLGNPARLYKVVSDIAASLTTDNRLSQTALISLSRGLQGLRLSGVHFVQVPVVAYAQNPNWVQWAPNAASLFRAVSHDRKLPAAHRSSGPHPRAEDRTATPESSRVPPASPAPRSSSSAAPTPLSHLSEQYGGITAHANVCRDAEAFSGPLGGH
jgi:LCP family protein required for cell wall assembly